MVLGQDLAHDMVLRIALDQISNNVTVEQQIRGVLEIKDKFHHSIELIDSRQALYAYKCVQYALRLVGDATYSSLVHRASHKQAFAGKQFVEWLIAKKYLLELPDSSAAVGSLIGYFNGQGFKHVGVLGNSNRVKSKWGDLCLFEHGFGEVPATYGNEIRIFCAIPRELALTAFRLYLKELNSSDSDSA
jgi:hypothetical protein